MPTLVPRGPKNLAKQWAHQTLQKRVEAGWWWGEGGASALKPKSKSAGDQPRRVSVARASAGPVVTLPGASVEPHPSHLRHARCHLWPAAYTCSAWYTARPHRAHSGVPLAACAARCATSAPRPTTPTPANVDARPALDPDADPDADPDPCNAEGTDSESEPSSGDDPDTGPVSGVELIVRLAPAPVPVPVPVPRRSAAGSARRGAGSPPLLALPPGWEGRAGRAGGIDAGVEEDVDVDVDVGVAGAAPCSHAGAGTAALAAAAPAPTPAPLAEPERERVPAPEGTNEPAARAARTRAMTSAALGSWSAAVASARGAACAGRAGEAQGRAGAGAGAEVAEAGGRAGSAGAGAGCVSGRDGFSMADLSGFGGRGGKLGWELVRVRV